VLFEFWLKIFGVAFGLGVVSGIVMAFQFGTNWSVLSKMSGPVQGPLLMYETFTAFMLEASFFGVLIFGRSRVPPWFYLFSTAMVALGTTFSAFWIMVNNSWMQVPSGYVIGDGIRKGHRRRCVMPRRRSPSHVLGSAAMSIQGCLEAGDQGGSSEGLAQKANGSGLQRSGADALIGEGRDENKRRLVTPGSHMRQKVQTAHGGHLHIRNDTQRVVPVGGLQEVLGRRKCMDQISMRAEKIIGRGADRCIVVYD
jgi:Cytochrome bd terminal oxidase subunit I